MKVGVALVDVVTGLHATVGILAALRHAPRERCRAAGRGEPALVAAVRHWSTSPRDMWRQGSSRGIMGNRHPSIAPYESYPTADKPFVVAVGNDRQFRACAEVLGAPELADDPRFATNPDRVAPPRRALRRDV